MVIFHAFFMVLAGLVWELGFGVKSGHFGTLGFIENNFWKNISARGAFPEFWFLCLLCIILTTTKKKKKAIRSVLNFDVLVIVPVNTK